jgi:tRNA nucleotidyltransferase (CCA-adding enzyme)
MNFPIPQEVGEILNRFAENGYEAYAVGGCVRDVILGRVPNDWDVTTSAHPEETIRLFADRRVLKTGLKHGTVTILSGNFPVEVTTFRVDGAYSDGRHPDSVSFTGKLEEDLARRDFTVNAMAYRPQTGLVDCFGGREDLNQKVIRCVGDPDKRYMEDGLRILRALRFASTLGFSLEKNTAESAVRNRRLIDKIAAERVRVEFVKLLCGRSAADNLRKCREVIAQFIPEIRPTFDFDQKNPHHRYDVWEHTLHSIEAVEAEPVLRLTMFLHDLGKPMCFTQGNDGVGHFYGHPVKSAELAKRILKRLRFDKKTENTILTLVKHHDLPLLPEERSLRKRMNALGEQNLRLLLKVEEADAKGKGTDKNSYLDSLKKVPHVLQRMMEQRQCFQLRDLAVNGEDLMKVGIPEGTEIGETLKYLLNAVLDGKCANTKQELLMLLQEEGRIH